MTVPWPATVPSITYLKQVHSEARLRWERGVQGQANHGTAHFSSQTFLFSWRRFSPKAFQYIPGILYFIRQTGSHSTRRRESGWVHFFQHLNKTITEVSLESGKHQTMPLGLLFYVYFFVNISYVTKNSKQNHSFGSNTRDYLDSPTVNILLHLLFYSHSFFHLKRTRIDLFMK